MVTDVQSKYYDDMSTKTRRIQSNPRGAMNTIDHPNKEKSGTLKVPDIGVGARRASQ